MRSKSPPCDCCPSFQFITFIKHGGDTLIMTTSPPKSDGRWIQQKWAHIVPDDNSQMLHNYLVVTYKVPGSSIGSSAKTIPQHGCMCAILSSSAASRTGPPTSLLSVTSDNPTAISLSPTNPTNPKHKTLTRSETHKRNTLRDRKFCNGA